MSRMDRYRKVHKESEKMERRQNFAVRKERQPQSQQARQAANYDDYDDYEEHGDSYYDQGGRTAQGGGRGQQPPKKKRFGFGRQKGRRKSSLKRKILWLLLLFIALETGSFFLGKTQADNDADIPQQEVELFSGTKGSDGSKNILLLGSDTRDGETARADTIMVLSLSYGKPKLASFMRDTYVNIPGYGYNKINAAYAYGGAELLRQTVEQNFGIACQYYAIVDFKSFEKAIDALFASGVKIDAEKDLDLDGVYIQQGQQRMDGHTLLQYARFRMDEEGDFGRVRRQQQVMTAIFSQLKNPLNLLRLPYAAGKVWGYTSTNIPISYLMSKSFTLAKGSSGIERLTVPVDDSWHYAEYDVGSVLDIDEAMNQQAVQAFFSK